MKGDSFLITGAALAESAFAAVLGKDSLQSYVFLALRATVDEVVADMPTRLVPRVRRLPDGISVPLREGTMHLAPARRGIVVRIEDDRGTVILGVENFEGVRYGRIADIWVPADHARNLLVSAVGFWPDLKAE